MRLLLDLEYNYFRGQMLGGPYRKGAGRRQRHKNLENNRIVSGDYMVCIRQGLR